jgi:signal transduction histidine kinase
LTLFRDSNGNQHMSSTDICSVVQSLTDDLIEQGLPVAFEGHSAVARCDPVLLRRVVSNLISNAVRYGQHAQVKVIQDQETVRIVVKDHGPGIPADQLEAVFEPFYRLENSRSRDTGGAGLGLYIARDLISRQGGHLRLNNLSEGGLEAMVTLPKQHLSALTQSR